MGSNLLMQKIKTRSVMNVIQGGNMKGNKILGLIIIAIGIIL